MTIQDILYNIPFFNHLTVPEIQALCAVAQTKPVMKGERIDIKKIKSFGVIIDGMFELGPVVKGEIVYLAPGSFFGEIPFTTSHHTGSIKAVKNSIIMLMEPRDIYRALLSSYKGLKGYFKNIKKNGFDLTDISNTVTGRSSKVISVFSPYHNSGNSIFTAILGLTLSSSDSTIILDASYNGKSIFSIFGKEIPPAVSEKNKDNTDDGYILNRTVEIADNLSLLNISSGSRVRVNADILSPIIFLLSGRYKYIVIDHSDYEKDFTDSVLGVSDIVFSVIKSIKDKAVYNIYDSALKDGQRLYYVLNRHYARDVGFFEGGYMLERLDIDKKTNILTNIKNNIEKNGQKIFSEIPDLIIRDRTALVVQTNLVNSVFLSGFFSSLYEKDYKTDMIYASSWSYLIVSLFILSRDSEEFEKRFLKFFPEERINSMLDITFPEDHVYKNGKIYNYADDLAGSLRLEHNSTLPAAMLAERQSGEHRIFTTGYMRDIFTASFILDLFEPYSIAGGFYHSGFPNCFIKPEDLLRTDIDSIRCISVNNRQRLNFGGRKLLKFYKGYIDGLEKKNRHALLPKSANDFYIEADTGMYNLKEILEISKNLCKDMK